MYTRGSTGTISPPSLPSSAQGAGSALVQRVEAVFYAIVDSLLFIWYAIVYALHKVDSLVPYSESSLFPEGLLCSAHNFAKWQDLSAYVAYRRNPITVVREVVEKIESVGLTPVRETLSPTPFIGHCYGNVIYFLERWEQTRDISVLASEFRGGSPLKGAFYQAAYETLFEPLIDGELVATMHQLIEQYPKIDLDAATLPDTIQYILDGTLAFLQAGHHPKNGGFLEFMLSYANEKNKTLSGKILCSVREVAIPYEKQDLNEMARITCILEGVDLTVEKFCLLNGEAQAAQEQLDQIAPGSYMLNFPACSSSGEIIGSHSVALIVTDQAGYIYDSNFGIAQISPFQITATLSRLIGHYTGLQNYQFPTALTWVTHWLQFKPNPPSDLFMPHFELIKITSTSEKDALEKIREGAKEK